MKRLLYVTMTFVLLMLLVTPAAAGSTTGLAQDGEPSPGGPEEPGPRLFLPLMMSMHRSYLVVGQIRDVQDMPLSGVTITDRNGRTTVTDENGIYRMNVTGGSQTLSPSKDGYNFRPASAKVEITQNLDDQHFTAILACANLIPNPGFETVPFYWNPISGNSGGYKPYYTTERANTGLYSGFTGIRTWETNVSSWSRYRTHELTIPANTTSMDFTFALWPATSEAVTGLQAENPGIVGFDTESPDAPALAGDAQYVAVIDPVTNVVLEFVVWNRWNDQAWVNLVPVSLMAYIGTTIKLEIGVYNDGYGGVTSMFIDDVNVTLCTDDVFPSGCSNILLNSDFEGTDGWIIKTANISSTYSTDYWLSPSRSMRNGITPASTNPYPNQWTTSEFYQPVTIPATAYSVRLRANLLPLSDYYWNWWDDWWWWWYWKPIDAADDSYDPKALAASEAQYGFIMDATATYSVGMLFKWYHSRSAYWLYREYDMLNLRGQTVSVLFGAANDGYDGNSAMFVDDVTLEVCHE